jgi:hypothetical protein
MNKKWIVGNWKMYGTPAMVAGWLADVRARFASLPPSAEVVVCPPSPLLHLFSSMPFKLGAQDCHGQPEGAYTGDVAAPMLAALGCGYLAGAAPVEGGRGRFSMAVPSLPGLAVKISFFPARNTSSGIASPLDSPVRRMSCFPLVMDWSL